MDKDKINWKRNRKQPIKYYLKVNNMYFEFSLNHFFNTFND